jgi:uncharacterized tellurite resistance protein B-like protein
VDDQVLGDRRRALEEAFFARRNEELLVQFREKEAATRTKQELSAASGINDEAVLDQLLTMHINRETLAALSLVPLVQVAWADGSVVAKERTAVMAAAEQAGLRPGDASHQLLRHWLEEKPEPTMFQSWTDYAHALSATLSAEARQALKQDVLGRARHVAEAAGGILGIGKVSHAEQAVLDQVEQAFR